jgi:tetratricopeptide (TPR) repeat protein
MLSSTTLHPAAKPMRLHLAVDLIFLMCMFASGKASPAEAKPASLADPTLLKARERFAKGTALVQAAQWAEALSAFEESSKLRPHAITTYNMGACQRALGRYTVARATLEQALSMKEASSALPESLAREARTYLNEIDRLLVHLDLRVAPSDAEIAIDGRPLQATSGSNGKAIWVAGVRPGGRGEPLPAEHSAVLLDPGTHLFTLSRKGFKAQLLTKTFDPGKRDQFELNLDKLPATLRVSSNQPQAIVRINRIDVGYAPAEIERPAGAYDVSVQRPGFVTYETLVRANPGEAVDIMASLKQEKASLVKKWWFWTAAGALVGGAVLTTYLATRSEPAPERPPLDGGGLGWTIQTP